jgi:hypothetical protein
MFLPPRGLLPYCGEQICASQWPGELCWRERKLLVGPPMQDRSKGMGQTNCSPWSSRLGDGHGANDSTPDKFTVTKPWRRQRHTQGFSASKGEEIFLYILTCTTPDIEIRNFNWDVSIRLMSPYLSIHVSMPNICAGLERTMCILNCITALTYFREYLLVILLSVLHAFIL